MKLTNRKAARAKAAAKLAERAEQAAAVAPDRGTVPEDAGGLINRPHPPTDVEALQRCLLGLLAELDDDMPEECRAMLREALKCSAHLHSVVHPDGRWYRPEVGG